jgi:hypothetical protein
VPSVRAASSCSSPTSRSTGVTSRTTYGSDTNRVASTMPGSEKMTSTPCSDSQPPNQPRSPYTRMSARPMTAGDTANGRSTTASSSLWPGKRWRTSTTAQARPNRVLSGTAIAATRMVRYSACSASGVVMACQTGAAPAAKVRHTTALTGSTRTSAR